MVLLSPAMDIDVSIPECDDNALNEAMHNLLINELPQCFTQSLQYCYDAAHHMLLLAFGCLEKHLSKGLSIWWSSITCISKLL